MVGKTAQSIQYFLMYPSPAKGEIRPQLSSMPRQKTEASVLLDNYKLASEKKRLQQELQIIDQRRQQISQRLALIESQAAQLEHSLLQIRHKAHKAAIAPIEPKAVSATPGTYSTLFFEY